MRNSTAKKYNFSDFENESTDSQENKIELVCCKEVNNKCTSILASINEGFRESAQYRNDKNFIQAIAVLKKVYLLTFNFTEITCFKCGELFRSTIIESMENIRTDLKSCSKGLFKRNDFQSSIEFTEDVIQELKAMKGRIDDQM